MNIKKSLVLAVAAAMLFGPLASSAYNLEGYTYSVEPGGSIYDSSWVGMGTGNAYYNHGGRGWAAWYTLDPNATLPPVTVIGAHRWTVDVLYPTESYLSPAFNFDSRNAGFYARSDKVTAPPDNKNRVLCLQNCKDVKAAEEYVCDDRAIVITEFSGVSAIVMYLYQKMRRPRSDRPDYTNTSPATIWGTGGAIGSTYNALCKARARERWNNCEVNTCRA